MKELLKQYAAYNSWANQRMIESILSLSEEKQQQSVASSFPSLQATLLHMWDAESAWWQRIKLQERLIMPSDNFKGTIKDITTGISQLDQQWMEWVGNANENAIEHVIQYYNSKREHFKQPVWQIMLHVFNHNNYHRGQLVTMMRQLGIEKIPATDFVVWTRKR